MKDFFKNWWWAILIVLLIIAFYQYRWYGSKETFKTKVTGKERITQSNGDGQVQSFYLIYTEKGSFTLKDEFIYGNFNSSDTYGRIKVDSTYTLTTIGWRMGWTSTYPNIIKIE